MSLNIDTLLLEIDYQHTTNALSKTSSKSRVAECEKKLKDLIQLAFKKGRLPELPSEYDSIGVLQIPDIEVTLPDIDAHAFLNDAQRYFEQELLPTLLKSFTHAVSQEKELHLGSGAGAGIDIDASNHLSKGLNHLALSTPPTGNISKDLSSFQGLSRALPENQLKNPPSNLPEYLAKECEYFIQQVVTPRGFVKFFNSLVKKNIFDINLLKKQLNLFLPSIDHSRFFVYLGRKNKSLLQQKNFLKLYLDVLLHHDLLNSDAEIKLLPKSNMSFTSQSRKNLLLKKQILEANKSTHEKSLKITNSHHSKKTQGIIFATELSLNLTLKIQALEKPAEMAYVNFNYYKRSMHEALLMAQSAHWLNACESWLNIVMQKTPKVSDFLGLESLLKCANGSVWLGMRDPHLYKVAIISKAPIIYNIKQEIEALRSLLTLLEPFQKTNQYPYHDQKNLVHLTKLKQFLGCEPRLPKADVLRIKRILLPLFYSERANAILIFNLPERVLKIGGLFTTYRRKNFTETTYKPINSRRKSNIQGHLSNSTTVRKGFPETIEKPTNVNKGYDRQKVSAHTLNDILTHLKTLATFDWMPLLTKKRLERLVNELRSGAVIEDDIQCLQQDLLTWSEFLVGLIHKQQLNTVESLSPEEQAVFKNILQMLDKYIEIDNRNEKPLVEKDGYIEAHTLYHLISLALMRVSHRFTSRLESVSKCFIREGLRVSAIELKTLLLAWIAKSTRQQHHFLSIRTNHYVTCFQAESTFQKSINAVLMPLESVFDSPTAMSMMIPAQELNKREIYAQIVQLLTLLYSWRQSDTYRHSNKGAKDTLNLTINELIHLKSTLLQQDKTLASHSEEKEHWWLSIVENEIATCAKDHSAYQIQHWVTRLNASQEKIKALSEKEFINRQSNKNTFLEYDKDITAKAIIVRMVAEICTCIKDLGLVGAVVKKSESSPRQPLLLTLLSVSKSSGTVESLLAPLKKGLKQWTQTVWRECDRVALKNEEREQRLINVIEKITILTHVDIWQETQIAELIKAFKSLFVMQFEWPEILFLSAEITPFELTKNADSLENENDYSISRIRQLHELIWQPDLIEARAILKVLSSNSSHEKDTPRLPKSMKSGSQKNILHKDTLQKDTLQKGTRLKRPLMKNRAINKSLALLNLYREKSENIIDLDAINNVSKHIENDIKKLLLQQQIMGEGGLSGDGGLVLLWPYLPMFFKKNNLLKSHSVDSQKRILKNNEKSRIEKGDNKPQSFINETAQLTAHALLIYLLGEFHSENDRTVANILVGLEPETVIDNSIVLSDPQCASADQLIKTLIGNWSVLKNMPVNSFRHMFLLRNARCSVSENGFMIEVESRSEDILLAKYPWGLGYISLPWLGKTLIEVVWEYGY